MRAHAGLIALGLLAAGCSGGSGTAAAVVSATPSVSPSAAPSVTTAVPAAVRPTATVAATSSPALTKDFGFFAGVEEAGPPAQLRFDRAYFLTGDEAVAAAKAHGQEAVDYYVVNDNKLLRTVTLAADVVVVGSLQLNSFAGHEGVVDEQPRTVRELLGFLGSEAGRETGFHLTYGSGGQVTRVAEQYVP